MSKTNPKSCCWEKLNNSQKKLLAKQQAILILGSRELNELRIINLASKLANKKQLIFACIKEKYIAGFENCPQFASLSLKKLSQTLSQLPTHLQKKITILEYPQNYAKYLIRELNPSVVIVVRGSYQHAFHYTPLFYEIIKHNLKYKLISPFASKKEALAYEKQIKQKLTPLNTKTRQKYSDKKLMNFTRHIAKQSFDYTFQTGAVLAKNGQFLLAACNRVMPYQTAMLHLGSSKEKHLGPPQDLNYYDTNHAEVEIILQALKNKIDLSKTTLYINLLPCPVCARMLARSPIAKIIYRHDHSHGYGFRMLESAGKKLQRAG